MHPRDLFDGVVIAVLLVAIYLHLYGPTLYLDRVLAVIEALLNLDVAVYLVLAGILGVVFVGYIAIYLPYKHSQNPAR